ncbi:hypothetical protein ACFLW2_04460 [Chloroflexota bacterium]
MVEEKEQIIDVDAESDLEEDETSVRSVQSRKTYRCAYCKQSFPNLVLVKKHIKVCASNPHNP